MLYLDLKKWVALFVSFVFLANQCSPLYAAPKQTRSKKSSSQSAQKKPASLTDKSKGILEQKVSEAQPKDDEWYVEDAKKAVNQTCMKINDPHNANRKNVGKCIAPLKKFEKDALEWNKKILNSTTCVGGEKGSAMYCYPTVALARGIIRSVLQKKPNENRFLLFDTAAELSDFTELIYLYGVQSEEDLRLAVRFCTDVISFYGSSCDGGGKGAGSRCDAQISAVLAVSALNLKGNGAYIKSAQDTVYSFLKKNYEGSGGAAMKVAIIALATINTKGSWRYIEQFLTKDSHPGILSETLDVLTPITFVTNAAAKVKAIEKWGSTSYRNATVDQFMYVDWQENKRQGKRGKAQYPYGNMLEDIGRFIGEKAAVNPEARRVAQEIMNHANGWAKARKRIKGARYMDATLHWPVVIGILDGYRKHGKRFIYVPSPELLGILYNGDFWDLNEGTQQRVHYKAWLFAQQRGWGWQKPLLDRDKITRSNQTAKAIKWAQIADIATMVASLGVGFLSKIPAVSRGMVKAVSYLNATKARMFKPMNFARKAPGKVTKTVVEEERVGVTMQQGRTPVAANSGNTGRSAASSTGRSSNHMHTGGNGSGGKNPVKPEQAADLKKAAGSGSTGKPAAKPSPKRTEPTPRTGNHPSQAKEKVTGPLDQQVQQAKAGASQPPTAAERLSNSEAPKPDLSSSAKPSSVMQRVKEEAADIKEAFSRWWKKESIEAQKVGIMPGEPQINPFAGLGDAYKGVKAERKAAAATKATIEESKGAWRALENAEKEVKREQIAFDNAGWGADGSPLLQAEKNLEEARNFAIEKGRDAERARKKLAAQNRYVESSQRSTQSLVENAQLRLDNRTAEWKAIQQNTALQKTDPEMWAQLEEEAYMNMAKASEELTAAEKAAASTEKVAATAEQATGGKAVDEGADMLTPLGDMKSAQAMQVLDPQATKLPILRQWESFASKMRRQQGINRRINEVRSSLPKSIDSTLSDVALLRNNVPKHVLSRLGDLEKKLQGISKEMQLLAVDPKINQSTKKVESLLGQIASKDVSGAEKQRLFVELNKEREQLFASLESYRDRIVPELQRARSLLDSVRGESDLSRTYNNIRNMEKRLSNAEDLLKGDLASLKQWSGGRYVEAIGSDIEGMVAKEKRIAQAARNKAAKQEFKASQRKKAQTSQMRDKPKEPAVQGNALEPGEGFSPSRGSETLKSVSSVDSKVSGVYELKDASGRTVAYAKATNATEVARTKQVQGIIEGASGGLRAKYPQIEIEYPRVLTENLSDLPAGIQKSISRDLQRVRAQNSTRAATLKETEAREFVMSSVDTGGMNLGDLDMLKFDVRDLAWEQPNPTAFFNGKMQSSMLQHLGGKPITQAEWTEVRGLVRDLNKAGFEHGDLGQNLFIKRSANGKLKVTLIDFEAATVKADQEVLNALEKMFQEYGALVP